MIARVSSAAGERDRRRFLLLPSRFVDTLTQSAVEVARPADEVTRFADEVTQSAGRVARPTVEVTRPAIEVI